MAHTLRCTLTKPKHDRAPRLDNELSEANRSFNRVCPKCGKQWRKRSEWERDTTAIHDEDRTTRDQSTTRNQEQLYTVRVQVRIHNGDCTGKMITEGHITEHTPNVGSWLAARPGGRKPWDK